MAAKDEWLEYFRLVNDREPTAEECAAAKGAGEIDQDSEPNQSIIIPGYRSENLTRTQGEWVIRYKALTGQGPKVDEIEHARQNGFSVLPETTTNVCHPAQPQNSQSEKDTHFGAPKNKKKFFILTGVFILFVIIGSVIIIQSFPKGSIAKSLAAGQQVNPMVLGKKGYAKVC